MELAIFILFLFFIKKLFMNSSKNKLEERDIQTESTSEQNNIQEIKHEIYEDIHYFYDSDDNFICQGSSLDEAAKNYSYMNGKNFIGLFVNKQDNKNMCFFDNECKTVLNVVKE